MAMAGGALRGAKQRILLRWGFDLGKYGVDGELIWL